MIRILLKIMMLCLGVLIGIAGTMTVYYLRNRTTEVWTAQSDLISDKGLMIPKGTELVHLRWMPEGFATLRLYLNVEGSTLDTFSVKQEPGFHLVIPYSVWAE